jgi:hypothetical protein
VIKQKSGVLKGTLDFLLGVCSVKIEVIEQLKEAVTHP